MVRLDYTFLRTLVKFRYDNKFREYFPVKESQEDLLVLKELVVHFSS